MYSTNNNLTSDYNKNIIAYIKALQSLSLSLTYLSNCNDIDYSIIFDLKYISFDFIDLFDDTDCFFKKIDYYTFLVNKVKIIFDKILTKYSYNIDLINYIKDDLELQILIQLLHD